MEKLRPVRWKEGMFLRPHHLQQHDVYVESRESGRPQGLDPYAWGIQKIELDEDALSNYVVSVKRLRAVLADGTLLDVPRNSRLPNRPFKEFLSRSDRPLNVSIGVRVLEERRAQTAPEGDGKSDTRFIVMNEPVYDMDNLGEPVPVEFLEYNLRLFLGDETVEGFETLPISRLVSTGDASRPVSMAPDFAPPVLVLAASQTLHRVSRAVLERLALVVRELGQEALGSDNPDHLVLFQALSGSLPVLRDMVHTGMAHPHQVYCEMARLAGTLFYRAGADRSLDEIPPYRHDDVVPVFEKLRQLITDWSKPAIERRWVRVPMERGGEGQFRAVIPAQGKKPGARFFLEATANESTPRIPMLVLAAKISSPPRIEMLRKHALPGVPTEPLPGPPPELPPGHIATYFRLKQEHEEWATHVMTQGELNVFLLGAPADLKFNLVVILPAA
ncbi:MAG TPA: type VI secretion system baseplate subunit TssK [Candidatus Polarisedimenticolia bacterium]|nr:type VI secretion system baseplate subunit TssK [Candidatus Polarisedimenticolia bacterium]